MVRSALYSLSTDMVAKAEFFCVAEVSETTAANVTTTTTDAKTTTTTSVTSTTSKTTTPYQKNPLYGLCADKLCIDKPFHVVCEICATLNARSHHHGAGYIESSRPSLRRASLFVAPLQRNRRPEVPSRMQLQQCRQRKILLPPVLEPTVSFCNTPVH
ncbi:hypothetical protein MTO96_051141 [Rhipicephalus appendiculatus]